MGVWTEQSWWVSERGVGAGDAAVAGLLDGRWASGEVVFVVTMGPALHLSRSPCASPRLASHLYWEICQWWVVTGIGTVPKLPTKLEKDSCDNHTHLTATLQRPRLGADLGNLPTKLFHLNYLWFISPIFEFMYYTEKKINLASGGKTFFAVLLSKN